MVENTCRDRKVELDSDFQEGVSICILTYNRCLLLRKLIFSLKNLEYTPLEIIVVDNHSEDETQNLMDNDFPNIYYIRTRKNIGVGARNLGFKSANNNIIISLDDDVFGINDNSIRFIVDTFRQRQNVGAINFKITDHDTGSLCNWAHHCKIEGYCDREFLTYEITEGAAAFRRTALERAGYYPEYFFLSHEGPDLAFRMIDNDYIVIYSSKVAVIHCHSNLGRKGWTNYYYDTRNQFWLAARNLPFAYAAKYLMRGLASMAFYSARDGYFIYWIKAVVDALKGLNVALKDRKVLSRDTMKLVKDIDKNRPNIFYYIKNRFFNKSVRL